MKFVAFLNAYSQGLSGGDACFINFVRVLRKANEVQIVTSKMGSELCRAEKVRANFIITTREGSFKNIIRTYLRRIFMAMVKVRPRGSFVLYSSSDSPPDVGPIFLLRLVHRRSFWVQKIYHIIPRGQGFRRFVQLTSFFFIKLLADLVIVDSETLKGELANFYGFRLGKLAVVNPGFDFEYIRSVKPSLEKYDGIFVGQLRESKGVLDLIPIWKQVMAEVPGATLAIVGKDLQNNRQKIKSTIASSGLGRNATLQGFLGKGTIYGMMKTAKVLLLPSYEEGFGMVVVEALACGLRPVAYKLPVYNEFFKGRVTTVPVGDIKAFSAEIIKFLQTGGRRGNVSIGDLAKKFDVTRSVEKEIFLIGRAMSQAH